MWITRQLKKHREISSSSGVVVNGESLLVQGEYEHREPESVYPFGIYSKSPRGEKAILLNGIYIGVSGKRNIDIEEGEVCIFSSGGARILLKNDGKVYINGKEVG